MNYNLNDIEEIPAMSTIRADEYGLAFRCGTYFRPERHSSFIIYIHAIDCEGNISESEGDIMTRDVPENGFTRDELIESANEYIREMLEEE